MIFELHHSRIIPTLPVFVIPSDIYVGSSTDAWALLDMLENCYGPGMFSVTCYGGYENAVICRSELKAWSEQKRMAQWLANSLNPAGEQQ